MCIHNRLGMYIVAVSEPSLFYILCFKLFIFLFLSLNFGFSSALVPSRSTLGNENHHKNILFLEGLEKAFLFKFATCYFPGSQICMFHKLPSSLLSGELHKASCWGGSVSDWLSFLPEDSRVKLTFYPFHSCHSLFSTLGFSFSSRTSLSGV